MQIIKAIEINIFFGRDTGFFKVDSLIHTCGPTLKAKQHSSIYYDGVRRVGMCFTNRIGHICFVNDACRANEVKNMLGFIIIYIDIFRAGLIGPSELNCWKILAPQPLGARHVSNILLFTASPNNHSGFWREPNRTGSEVRFKPVRYT